MYRTGTVGTLTVVPNVTIKQSWARDNKAAIM